MYAVIETGGKQYRVNEGSVLLVEKLIGVTGDEIAFDKILAISKDENLLVGTPLLKNAVVNAQILEQMKAPKVYAFHIRRRKGFRKKVGHRQQYTRVKIKEISI
ncbi:MAG: 50S ribosomal protein L21 [Deltaproteobacteria bacterium]